MILCFSVVIPTICLKGSRFITVCLEILRLYATLFLRELFTAKKKIFIGSYSHGGNGGGEFLLGHAKNVLLCIQTEGNQTTKNHEQLSLSVYRMYACNT